MDSKPRTAITLPERLERFQMRAVRRSLKATGGNITHAAARLGITYRQLRYILAKHS